MSVTGVSSASTPSLENQTEMETQASPARTQAEQMIAEVFNPSQTAEIKAADETEEESSEQESQETSESAMALLAAEYGDDDLLIS